MPMRFRPGLYERDTDSIISEVRRRIASLQAQLRTCTTGYERDRILATIRARKDEIARLQARKRR